MLPLLEARLCTKQQRDMVWRTLQAMPLRLLERVLPWLAGAGLTLQDVIAMPATVTCMRVAVKPLEVGNVLHMLLQLKFPARFFEPQKLGSETGPVPLKACAVCLSIPR